MPRCGECKHFMPQVNNSAANEGACLAQIDADGLAIETDMYMDAAKCPVNGFEELERIRTNVQQFSWDPLLRTAGGFEEK